MHDAQQSYVHAVEALAKSVERMEHTMNTWETAYLPHMIGVVPKPPMQTPEATPTEIGTQDYQEMEVTNEEENVTSTEPQHDVSPPHMDLPSMQRMQDRSLRHCCERVVRDNQQEERPREAMRPFRSRA